MMDGQTKFLPRTMQYDEVVEEAKKLFLQRNAEYGDAFEECGLLGAVVELTGCTARLKKLVIHGNMPSLAELESKAWEGTVRDKLLDTLNYAIISLMLLDEMNLRGR
jgi:hypothetical protein